jgi:hypothetical protein
VLVYSTTRLRGIPGQPSARVVFVGATRGDNLAGRLNVNVLAYTIIAAGDNGSAGNFTLTVTQP